MVSNKKALLFSAKNLIDVKYEINLEKIQSLIVLGTLTVGNGIDQWKKVCSTARYFKLMGVDKGDTVYFMCCSKKVRDT